MNDIPEADPGDLPEAVALPRRRRNLQLVWLVPALAAIIGLGLGVRAMLAAGPSITIQFPSAEGLEPGTTKIRYKNVDIGTLKTVRLTPERDAVVVTAAMSQGAQSMLLDDTRFWVVRPRSAGGELTGVSTLLSGVYIGFDVGKSAAERLAAALGGALVWAYPAEVGAEAGYRVNLAMQRFDSEPGLAAHTSALWTVRRLADGRQRAGRSTLRTTPTDASLDALAVAHAQAVAGIADDIARDIAELARVAR